jgi:signal transduction histidine kinase
MEAMDGRRVMSLWPGLEDGVRDDGKPAPPGAADRRARLLALARARWAIAVLVGVYAVAMIEFDLYGPAALALPRPFFLLFLPLYIVAYNALAERLARRGRHLGAATGLMLGGDLTAVTLGINGTGGVASWLWTLYPLITLEAAYLTEQRRWTVGTAIAAAICYGLEMVLEARGLLVTVRTSLTAAENQLPTAYRVLKWSWLVVMNAVAAIAGLVGLGTLGVLRRALERAYARLDAQYARLRQLDALKSQFLSVVSHELRTPLAIIQGYTELVEEDRGISPESRAYLVEAGEAVGRLGRRIEQMLAFSSLASGEARLDLSEVRAVEAVAEAVALREAACRARGLVMMMAPTPDVVLTADAARLVTAIGELIDNACHVTPAGGTVGVGARQDGASVAFEVWDTGPGMPDVVREHLGEPFVQPSLKLSEHEPGLGLGLAYARLVALRHGGGLEVGAREGGGAVVRLVLPVEAMPAPAPILEPAVPAPSALPAAWADH